jgi:hypothetical protein
MGMACTSFYKLQMPKQKLNSPKKEKKKEIIFLWQRHETLVLRVDALLKTFDFLWYVYVFSLNLFNGRFSAGRMPPPLPS